jgi:hypothetical protein
MAEPSSNQATALGYCKNTSSYMGTTPEQLRDTTLLPLALNGIRLDEDVKSTIGTGACMLNDCVVLTDMSMI